MSAIPQKGMIQASRPTAAALSSLVFSKWEISEKESSSSPMASTAKASSSSRTAKIFLILVNP